MVSVFAALSEDLYSVDGTDTVFLPHSREGLPHPWDLIPILLRHGDFPLLYGDLDHCSQQKCSYLPHLPYTSVVKRQVLVPGASVRLYATGSTQLSSIRCVLPSVRHLRRGAHYLYHFVFPCPMMHSDTARIFNDALGGITQHTWGPSPTPVIWGTCYPYAASSAAGPSPTNAC